MQLPADDSELAQRLTKDPLVLSFLGLTGKVAERDLEQAVMDKLTSMLLELGHGTFASELRGALGTMVL